MGEKPYIDPRYKTRSPGEDLFVDIVIKCFEFVPSKRISVFEIVDMLRKAIDATLTPGMTKQQVLKGVKTLI